MEARDHPHAETGGVLLGYESPDGDVVIAEALGPGPRAIRTSTTFNPDSEWQQALVAERYAASGRIHTYLGDWHTHPEGVAWPSRVDRRTLRRIARDSAARAPRAIMAILAPDADGILAVWQHSGHWRGPRSRSWRVL